ncbi:MAG: hypothetical protein FWD49_07830, partial [Firmicutes bacterium]|nr:hypothetical protein [Bacillota bacterium]
MKIILNNTVNGSVSELIKELGRNRTKAHSNINTADENHIFIAPDRFTLSVEQEIFEILKLQGVADIEVQSFMRLAIRELSKLPPKRCLTKEGAVLLLKKTADKVKDSLVHYRLLANSRAFAKEMYPALASFKTSGITHNDIEDRLDSLFKSTKAKAKDIAVLLKAYNEELLGYDDTTTRLERLRDLMVKSPHIKNSHIYIGGFFHFSKQESDIIARLMLYAKSVSVALPHSSRDCYPWETLERLKLLAEENNKEVEIIKTVTAVPEPFGLLSRRVFSYEGEPVGKGLKPVKVYIENTIYDEFN